MAPTDLSNVVAIACGGGHDLALKADGTVAGWGANTYGQTRIPVGLSNVVAVAAGSTHSLALKADGKVVAWGGNNPALTNVPANVTNIIAIAAGRDNVLGGLALNGDGQVLQWGSGPLVPQRLTNVVAIAAGYGSCYGLIGDGPPFPADPPVNRVVPTGSEVSLRMGATGARPLYYQWRFNGVELPGATAPILTIPNFQAGNAGLYDVRIANAAGMVTTLPALVNIWLLINNQPSVQVVPAGSTAVFSVTAFGSAPITYQWKKNGTNLIGATSSTLSIGSVQPSDVALYSVLVTDRFGQSATSDSVWLSLGTPGTGTGLAGDYYSSRSHPSPSLGWPTFSRVDPIVDFDWSTNAPDPRISRDNFTIRWTGEVQPFASGTYTFHTRTDDGVRLWVDGRLLIDKWIAQAATEWSNSIVLSRRHPLSSLSWSFTRPEIKQWPG